MGQSRNKTGVDFEEKICKLNGWTKKSTRPIINWSGKGRSNWIKMKQVNLDPTKFKANLDTSKLDKYDAIDGDGNKIEIKKYFSSDLISWKMYSEPIFKVSTRPALKSVISIFGEGDKDTSVKNYNKFVEGMIPNIGQYILESITKSNIGIQLEDKFIPQNDLEYRWNVRKGWLGYNRLSIEFRIKQNYEKV